MERTKERSLFFRKFIGDKKFYMMVLAVAVPEWNYEFRESAG